MKVSQTDWSGLFLVRHDPIIPAEGNLETLSKQIEFYESNRLDVINIPELASECLPFHIYYCRKMLADVIA